MPPDSLLSDQQPPFKPAFTQGPDFRHEQFRMDEGFTYVAGLDEAGRGPLAGPVVAACVILDPDKIPAGLNDSKKLTARIRTRLHDEILASGLVSVASASAAEIDRTDIRAASLDSMRRAAAALEIYPDFALIDGRDVPSGLVCPAQSLIKGDARSLSIAAASIIAKVTRDRMMARAALAYPGYGFETHMGYGTAVHRAAIERLGPCAIHRMSFRPLKTG